MTKRTTLYVTENFLQEGSELHEALMEALENSKDNITQKDITEAEDLENHPHNKKYLNASKYYLIDKDYSKKPVAECANTRMGLPTCNKGEGRYCYYRKSCELQNRLDGSDRLIPSAAHLLHKKATELHRKTNEEMSDFNPEDLPDEYYDELTRRILE